MTTDLVIPKPRNDGTKLIVDNIELLKPRIPPGIPVDNFLAAIVVEANALKPGVDPKSVARSALHCAIVGLIPGKPLNHAWFVPFKNNKRKPPVEEAQLMIGYEGFLELAFRNAFLKSVYTDVVLEGEEFFHGVRNGRATLDHTIPIDRESGRERTLASYCVWENSNGGRGLVVVPKKDLDAIANKQHNVWDSDFSAMAKKTAIRRAAKSWRKSSALAHAVRLDEQIEIGEGQDGAPEIEGTETKARLSFSQLHDSDAFADGAPDQVPAVAGNGARQPGDEA